MPLLPFAAGSPPPISIKRTINQTAHGLVLGNIVRWNGTAYVAALADTVNNAEVVGMVSQVIGANTFVLTIAGYVTTGFAGLTPGAVYFLSPTVAGAVDILQPTTPGQVRKAVLIAESATAGYFSPFWIGEVVSTPFTTGAVLFGEGGTVGEDPAEFFWDTITKRLGIGAATPANSRLQVFGSLSLPTNSTAVDLLLTSAHHTIRVDASGANRTITLPSAVGIEGRTYVIKKTDNSLNTVIIDADGVETINGATTQVLAIQNGVIRIQSNNISWDII